ncbi:choloylglycine hydrolase [Bizionia arctica]|uniref:Choloylglycine hydrolase n=2 Tax=Bizionia arctica TaxID=1495645 RepID=A0A917GKZ6_9FLAO|nr:choloylglycine hydrolase [Bizionia arctica]
MLFAQSAADACTGIMLRTTDGKAVSGRTLEFGIEISSSLVAIPRNYSFVGKTDNGDGLKYKTKYAVTGMITFQDMVIADGMNSAGLSSGIFFFPTLAEYTPLTKENQSKALSPLDFNHWVLSQFATVEEVRAAVENNEVVIVPTVLDNWGPTAPPFHYAVYDKNGNSIVIEPMNGKLVVSNNPIGVLTNSPSFDWHMTNLRNYTSLKPENADSMTIEGLVFPQLGQGSGMYGIPGDFTPPSRFVRATAFCATADPVETTFETVKEVFHILNNFDIPKGFSREVSNGVVHADYTMVTCARDPHALKYYYKTYNNQDIKVIDLNEFDADSKDILILNSEAEKDVFNNVSKKLKPLK